MTSGVWRHSVPGNRDCDPGPHVRGASCGLTLVSRFLTQEWACYPGPSGIRLFCLSFGPLWLWSLNTVPAGLDRSQVFIVPRVRSPKGHQETSSNAKAESCLLFQHVGTNHPTPSQDGSDSKRAVGASFKPY